MNFLTYLRSDSVILLPGPGRRAIEGASIALLCAAAVPLIALQIKPLGWLILLLGVLLLPLTRRVFARNIFLVYVAVGILGVGPITTDVSYYNMIVMGLGLAAALLFPYYVSRYLYRDHIVRFRWHHGRRWYKKEIAYVLLSVVVAYLLLPFYLRNTGAYLNWTVEPGVSFLTRLFVGTNLLGIWDELFFVSTVLGIFRRFLKFHWANLAQAVLFTSFLYELGFTGWGFIMIFIFAIIQGLVFRKTDSLFYVISIHLAVDLVLYGALINVWHPTWLGI